MQRKETPLYCIVGKSGAGKTTLVEQHMYIASLTEKKVIPEEKTDEFLTDLIKQHPSFKEHTNSIQAFAHLIRFPFINVKNDTCIEITTSEFGAHERAEKIFEIATKYVGEIKVKGEDGKIWRYIYSLKEQKVVKQDAIITFPSDECFTVIAPNNDVLLNCVDEDVVYVFIKSRMSVTHNTNYIDWFQELLMTDINKIDFDGYTIIKN